jgi:hypothetical protein
MEILHKIHSRVLELRQQLYDLGFKNIIIAGKGNYTFTIDQKKQKASGWKKN